MTRECNVTTHTTPLGARYTRFVDMGRKKDTTAQLGMFRCVNGYISSFIYDLYYAISFTEPIVRRLVFQNDDDETMNAMEIDNSEDTVNINKETITHVDNSASAPLKEIVKNKHKKGKRLSVGVPVKQKKKFDKMKEYIRSHKPDQEALSKLYNDYQLHIYSLCGKK